ncbi:MAG TPA: hypothetical protein VFG94_02320 [Acidimicrobiales bacterium]|nr:hypothetical protein [Acidimicrobiales bacterium]
MTSMTSRSRRSLTLRRLGCALVVGGVALVAGLPGARAGAQEREQRILVISLPGLTWAEVRDNDLPNIEAFLDDAALADMAPRGVSARATPGAAYLTISAGTRASSDPLVDGQQLAVDQQSAGSTAGEIFERRTGTEPDGTYVSLAWPTLERVNADEPYDAELGALAEALQGAGLGAVAIGNADGSDTVAPSYERQVGLAAVTGDGVVPAGELGDDLLTNDPTRPFGQRLDSDQVMAAFQDAWRAPAGRDGGMVLVEASDLARTMRYRDRVDADRYDQLRAQALADSDALVGRLLSSVDRERDAVLMVGPYNLPGDRDLTVAALQVPGPSRSGYLRSASTQRAGFLTLVDVAPTVLDVLHVERPTGMEGRPAEVVASGASLDDRVDHLVANNAASRFREKLLFPTTLVVVVLMTAVCAAAVVVIARGGWPKVSRAVTFVALADLAILPLSYLARGFPLEDLGIGFYWAFVLTGAVAVAGAATAAGRRWGRPRLALVAVLVLVLLVPVLDVMTGSNLSLSAAFGYSPTGNSRLYGISNYSFGQVAAASCLLAAFLAARPERPGERGARPERPGERGAWFPARRRRLQAVALLVALLVVIGVPVWGSDVGGILAFTPTILVFAVLVYQGRIRWRSLVIAGVLTLAAVVGFGLLDLARPEGQRAHLGRLFERVGDEGIQPLIDIVERKLLANLRVTTSSFWVAAIPVAIAFIVFLARYPGRPLDGLRRNIPTLQAGLVAAYLAALLGSAVNDSGAIVGGVTLMVLATALAVLVLERDRVPRAPAPADGVAERVDVEPQPEPPPRPEPEPVPGAGSRRS